MIITLVKQYDNSFKPAFDEDYDKVKKIKPLALVKTNITQPRNLKFLRKFFGLIDLVYQNQEAYATADELREMITIASGYVDVVYTLDGNSHLEAKSISFAKMKEEEFEQLYSAVLDSIEKYFHFDKQSVRDEIDKQFST